MGVLSLGKKKSDEDYTQDDLDILLPLARTLAIAISNAKLFEELARTQAEIAQKEKMATIGTLAASMAHEIRNPMTTIRIFNQYLPEKLVDGGFRTKFRDIVINEVGKVDHIIQTLVDFSADDGTTDLEAVAIPAVVDELLSVLQINGEVAERIEFVRAFPDSLPLVNVNRKELEEILLNLVQNAIHAIKDKGKITFTASEKGGFVELKITDTGCGMSEDNLKHAFSPFYTTKSKGFGLGLFVVKQLVTRNKGNISVSSKEGEGTAFKLALPQR
jgi:two-component system sensor histidine kinase HydH